MNRRTLFRGNQRIGHSAERDQASLHLRQPREAGWPTTGTHPAHPCSVEVDAGVDLSQGGGEQRGMAAKAKTHDADCSLGITGTQPPNRDRNIAEDVCCGGGVLVLPPQCKIRIGIAQLQ